MGHLRYRIGFLLLLLAAFAIGQCQIAAALDVKGDTSGPGNATAPAEQQRICAPDQDWAPSSRLVLLTARQKGGLRASNLALQESLASYFDAEVSAVPAASYTASALKEAKGLVVFANGSFGDRRKVAEALKDAHALGIPVAWIGGQAQHFATELGVKLDTNDHSSRGDGNYGRINYNGVDIETPDFEFGYPLQVRAGDGLKVLGNALNNKGKAFPIIAVGEKLAYAGLVPFDGDNENLSLSAVVDAISHVLGRHQPDPRVLLRLEDVNGWTYGAADTSFALATEFLRRENVFMHLSIIPEVVNEDQSVKKEEVRASIADAPGVLKLVRERPDLTEIVQHGFRHSRRDPRNKGCVEPGCAKEFFANDDRKMGRDAAVAFARSRLEAGREVLGKYLRLPQAYEAPHYIMSPAQTALAESMYPMIVHSPQIYAGIDENYFLPWFTRRGRTVYGPSDVGYVSYDHPASVETILHDLKAAATVLPDPILIVFYHPFISGVPGRGEDLERLVHGIRGLGYRFASMCAELSPRP